MAIVQAESCYLSLYFHLLLFLLLKISHSSNSTLAILIWHHEETEFFLKSTLGRARKKVHIFKEGSVLLEKPVYVCGGGDRFQEEFGKFNKAS